MKCKLLMITALIIILISMIYLTVPASDDKNSVKLRPQTKIFTYFAPHPYALTRSKQINGGIEVELIKEEDQWIKVKLEEEEVWIPAWYIATGEEEEVKTISAKPKVLNQNFSGCLSPNGQEIVELARGKLLTPIKEWKGWYQVEIIVYDIPAVLVAWVPKKVLSSVNTIKPIEGYLKKGTEVYYVSEFKDIFSTEPKLLKSSKSVQITTEEDGYLWVSGAAGWTAWTKKENLVYSQ